MTNLKTVVLLFIFLLISARIFSQEESTGEATAPPERKLSTAIGYTTLGIFTSNFIVNFGARLGNQPYAQTTFKSIWKNLSRNTWSWEDGDRFLLNQFLHPYQGSTYFASARANGFSFYESILFASFGSVMWEMFLEPEPSTNDLITTTVGGVALGEILHRLFLEIDSSQSKGAKVGGLLVSPISGYNKILNHPSYMTGGGNIYSLSFSSGVEKTFPFFKGHEDQADSWDNPGGNVNVNVVYGDPFIQQSRTPYEHFEFYAGFAYNLATYNAVIISDGYLLSSNLLQTDTTFTSTGLSMHFDFFNATNDIADNLGYGNLQFSSNAIGWALKHKYLISENSYIEAKVHTAFTFWANSMYNAYESRDTGFWVKLGNNRGTYGMGENVKLFFTISHYKAGKLELAATGYHVFVLKMHNDSSLGNVFFLYSSLSYDFPISKRICIGAKETFWGLFGLYDTAETINRRLVSSCLYVKFVF